MDVDKDIQKGTSEGLSTDQPPTNQPQQEAMVVGHSLTLSQLVDIAQLAAAMLEHDRCEWARIARLAS